MISFTSSKFIVDEYMDSAGFQRSREYFIRGLLDDMLREPAFGNITVLGLKMALLDFNCGVVRMPKDFVKMHLPYVVSAAGNTLEAEYLGENPVRGRHDDRYPFERSRSGTFAGLRSSNNEKLFLEDERQYSEYPQIALVYIGLPDMAEDGYRLYPADFKSVAFSYLDWQIALEGRRRGTSNTNRFEIPNMEKSFLIAAASKVSAMQQPTEAEIKRMTQLIWLSHVPQPNGLAI